MRKQILDSGWPFKAGSARETVAQLKVDVPDSFLGRHRALLSSIATLLETGKPVRILEYGSGEIEHSDALSISAICAAAAEKSGGQFTALVFSDVAAARGGHVGPLSGKATVINSIATPVSALGTGAFDLVVHHPVAGRKQQHPLHSFWSFIELEPLLVDGAHLVFERCESESGQRCEYIRDYLHSFGLRPSGWGEECAWQYQRRIVPVPQSAFSTGELAPLSSEGMNRESFLRIYDQFFAPLLNARAGTFRQIFETLLSRPGPYVIIETGTTRPSGDFGSNGQSTMLFDLFVNCFGGRVVSVDIDPTNVRHCRGRTSSRTTLICSDSVKALRFIPDVSEASLIYLDSYDFDGNNPHPSSLHHMFELAAIWKRTRADTLLVIDDCFGPEHGKHAYVSRYLDSVGIGVQFAGYQTAWTI